MAKGRTFPPSPSPAELAVENAQTLATKTADRLLQVNQLNQTLSASIRGASAYEAFKIDSPRYTGVVNIGRNLTQAVTAPFTGIRALAQDAQAYVMGQQRSVITGQFYPESGVLNGLKSQGLGYLGALAKDAAIGTVRAPRDLAHGLYQGNADEIGSGGAALVSLAGGLTGLSRVGVFEAAGPSFIQRIVEGNRFNATRSSAYQFKEVYVNKSMGAGYYKLDSYDTITNEIVSRKYTQFSEISEQTSLKYINEISVKYPRGATIANVPSNIKNGLVGQELHGVYVLEVPVQKGGVPSAVIDAAKKSDILIRDINGRIYQ